jgi:autotransporter passenger strand-loop-strand repeat protein
MTDTTLTSGMTATGTVLSNGDTLTVSSGGASFETVISNGAYELISAGGSASHATVSFGGYEIVSSGGVASGATVTDGGYQFVDAGGSASGTTVSSGGSELISSGGVTYGTVVVGNRGIEVISAGGNASGTTVGAGGRDLVFGTADGTQINSGGAEIVAPGGTASGTMVGSGGTQLISAGGSANGTVVSSGGTELFSPGGTVTNSVIMTGGRIELRNVAFDSAGTAVLDSGTDILTVTEGSTTYTQQLAGDYSGEYFRLDTDNLGGTFVTLEEGTPCYCRGTLILTDTGEVPVEDLRIGDRLMTHWGAARPIRWIGTRSYAGRFAAGNKNVLPVRIAAGALDENVPKRDLFVSPLHAMFLDGMLIPAHALVNGTSIVQATQIEQVEYFHLELDFHDVIVAEGALSESFVDDDSRGMFQNAADHRRLYPDAGRKPAEYCAPIVEDGEELEAVRRRIAGRYVTVLQNLTIPAPPPLPSLIIAGKGA